MKKIVIVGGGYAGVHAGKLLNKAFKKNKDVSITLIDKNRFHTLMTELHEVAGNRVPEDSVRISFDRIFSGTSVNVVCDRVTGIDREAKVVKCEGEDFSYDYLIMGIGAEPTDFGIPGIRENALTLWSYDDAVRIKHHIIGKFREASQVVDQEARKKLLTFVVAGSGFTGIEMVGELIEWLPLLCDEYSIDRDEYKLINVEAMGNILNMIPEKPRAKAMKYLVKKGVDVRLKSHVSEVGKDFCRFKEGDDIECETLIWTCGVKGNTQGKAWGFTVGHVERLRVDEYMETPEQDGVYLAGDIQWYLHENERPIPQIVEAAEQTAAVAVKNIIHAITGKGKKTAFKAKFHGFMVSIGGRYGVSHTMGMSLSGIFAMALKHLVNCYYLHTVCGMNGWSKYLGHEIFHVKNKRSLLGGFIAGNIQALWAVPLRMWLGLMWLTEGVNKIGEGWLNRAKGSSSTWMFSSGVAQKGTEGYGVVEQAVEAVSAASEAGADGGTSPPVDEVVEVATDAAADVVSAASDAAGEVTQAVTETVRAWGPIWDLDKTIFPYDGIIVTWFRETFMDGMAAHMDFGFFQGMVVAVECLIGLALIGGLFTFPAAGVSIIMCLVFTFSGMFSWSQVWFIFAAFLMLGGAGRTAGLDYWAMPLLKKGWNNTSLAKRSYLYCGEPGKKRKKRR
ncbi:MAG: NAD(P)/FAD-dependent oxidoreductase [Spirochaetales bacterium]|nr:NAD(P)/FAD-dependent oxidoreductase [Spirochaetales bacterium]